LTANAFFFSDFFLGQPYTGWSKQPIIILFLTQMWQHQKIDSKCLLFFGFFFFDQPYTGWSKQPITILFFWIFFKTADADVAASKN